MPLPDSNQRIIRIRESSPRSVQSFRHNNGLWQTDRQTDDDNADGMSSREQAYLHPVGIGNKPELQCDTTLLVDRLLEQSSGGARVFAARGKRLCFRRPPPLIRSAIDILMGTGTTMEFWYGL